MNKFILSQEIVDEVEVNTEEVYPGLWISSSPSMGVKIGYAFDHVGNVIDVKFEENEGEPRLLVDDLKSEFGLTSIIPPIYGAIAAKHKVDKIQVGDVLRRCEIYINKPSDSYLSKMDKFSNRIFFHPKEGDLFVLEGDTYIALSEMKIRSIIEKHLEYDMGLFIDEKYLTRWTVGGGYEYHPIKYAFFPGSRHFASGYGTDEIWQDKADELIQKYTNLMKNSDSLRSVTNSTHLL